MILCCFLATILILYILLRDSDYDRNNLLELISESSNKLSLTQTLQHQTGINLFAKWLVAEFNIESLLFLIEVCQFRMILRNYIEIYHPKYIFNDLPIHFNIASNIPISQTISQYQLTHDYYDSKNNIYDYKKIAHRIREKYIIYDEDKNGSHYDMNDLDDLDDLDLCINISSKQRQKLANTDFNELSKMDLFYVFDDAFLEMMKVLKDPFQRFSYSEQYYILLKDSFKKHTAFSSPSSSIQSTQSIQINFDEKKDNINLNIENIDKQTSSNYNHHTTQSSMVRVENALHLGMFRMAKFCSSSCICFCCYKYGDSENGDRLNHQHKTHKKTQPCEPPSSAENVFDL